MPMITFSTILALVGCFMGWLSTILKQSEHHLKTEISNLIIGMVMAFTLEDYFITPEKTKLALLLGLICGFLGGYMLDIVKEILPDVLRTFIDVLIDKYRSK